MFRTRKYYGIDIDLAALAAGAQKYAGTFGIYADIRDLSPLPEGSAAAVVSTNTLYQLSVADRARAVKELCRLASPEGVVFIELPIDAGLPAVAGSVRTLFGEVRVIYYKNPVSRLYERCFERNGDLGSHPVAGWRLFRFLSWLISRLEFLTCHFRVGNRHAIVSATAKRSVVRRPFVLGTASGERIIKLLPQ